MSPLQCNAVAALLGAVSASSYKCAMIDSLTPLIAIDAIAFDTETTGLDVRKASVIEIGAVRIVGGILRPDESYRSLVRPEGPNRSCVRSASMASTRPASRRARLSEVWPRFAAFAGESVMIGHTIGFDLAILERQLAGCGLTWRRPRTLDTQLLAQLASPELGKCSLDTPGGAVRDRARRPAFRAKAMRSLRRRSFSLWCRHCNGSTSGRWARPRGPVAR